MAPIRRLAPAALALISILAVLAGGDTAGALAAGSTRAHHARELSCAKLAARDRHLSKRQRAEHVKACKKRRREAVKRRRRAQERRRAAQHRSAQRKQPSSTAAGASGCEDAALVPSGQNLALVTAATLCLINRERTTHGEAPLRSDEDLARAAQGHSESMAARGYFEHVSPDGQTPQSRIAASGYIYSDNVGYELGENIAWGSLGDATPAAIVADWMSSAPHRANILNAGFRDSGVGIAPRLPASFAGGQAGAIYTEDFGTILAG